MLEFYFILALTAWNNMLGPEKPDASRITAYAVIFVLLVWTGYIYYSFILAICARGNTQRETDKEVQRILLYMQRPMRLRRYKPLNFIYPVYYVTRRMILALICVFNQEAYAN